MTDSYEVEIKSLLGTRDGVDRLVVAMRAKDPALKTLGMHTQLNHYFVGGDLARLAQSLPTVLDDDHAARFVDIASRAKDFSLRTRLADQKLLLVLKASVDDTTSANGTARLEFEAPIPNLTLDELDAIVLKSGFTYQAKWSRDRTDYRLGDVNVSIDKNAGYGYLAELELIVHDPRQADTAKENLRALMAELGLIELPQDRLARMFDHYNAHWPEYYGTEKTFVIE